MLVGDALETGAGEHVAHVVAQTVEDEQHGSCGIAVVAAGNIFQVLAFDSTVGHGFGGLSLSGETDCHSD